MSIEDKMLRDYIINVLQQESCPISNQQLLRKVCWLAKEDFLLNEINSAVWGLAASDYIEITPQNLIKIKENKNGIRT